MYWQHVFPQTVSLFSVGTISSLQTKQKPLTTCSVDYPGRNFRDGYNRLNLHKLNNTICIVKYNYQHVHHLIIVS